MLKWIDSHTHLDIINKSPSTQQKIVDDSIEHGLTKLLTISTGIESYLNGKKVVINNQGVVYTTCGLYPSHADYYNDDLKNRLIEQLNEGVAVALGECGLDYYRNYGEINHQKKLFSDQIMLAKEYNLPLITHVREAYDDVYELLKKAMPLKGVIHCFSGGVSDVERFVDLGFYISFAGNVTYKKAVTLQDSCRATPLDRLLLETDAPYLTPVPYRGKTNYPYYIEHTGRFVAELKGESVEVISQYTCDNAIKLFNLNGD